MLRFNPPPYREPVEPTGFERANQWAGSLNDLGRTFGQINRQNRLTEQQELENKIRQLQVQGEYGTEGLDRVFGQNAPPPQRSILQPRPGEVAPLPDQRIQPVAMPGQPGFDEEAYGRRYGTKRLKLFQDREDRKRQIESSGVDMDYKRAMAEKARRPDPSYVIPTLDANGNVTGYEPLPAGTRPTAFAKPPAAGKGGSPDREAALNLYETARKGLLDGLRGTNTGPIMGRLPAFTSDQQIAEGAVAAMAPVLKQLFRVAGEGVFTDRDQALLLDMIPTRKTNPEAFMTQIENIDKIVKAKLGMSDRQGGRMSKQQRNKTTGETRTVFSDDGGQTWHP